VIDAQSSEIEHLADKLLKVQDDAGLNQDNLKDIILQI